MKRRSDSRSQPSLHQGLAILTFAVIGSLALATPISAQASGYRYVSDAMLINVRSGPSNQYRIIKRLASGTQLSVIKVSKDKSFSQIRLEDGTTGWSPTQYLMKEKGARERLEEAQKKIAVLSQDAGPMLKKMHVTNTTNKALDNKNQQLSAENNRISAEIQAIKKASANAISLASNNKTLSESNQLLKSEIDVLTADNERLKDKSDLEWFINGVGSVGFGVLLTLIIPRLIPKKHRNDWN